MREKNRYSAIISIVLVCALSSAATAHALIPHDDGNDDHTQSGHPSATWTSLHNALRGEDKKLLFLLVVTVVFIAVTRLIAPLLAATPGYARITYSRSRNPDRGEALRRGISPYRTFW